MSYPLCVFLDSREQRMLLADHPFYHLIEEGLQNVIRCPLILHYMAESTLPSRPRPNGVTLEQRIAEIIQYLRNSCPMFSGSDSPAMDSTFVDVRAYRGCGSNPTSRKFARKHVYIQKRLVDAWMQAECSKDTVLDGGAASAGHFYLLTFFMKLCLLRALITAVKATFTSEDINTKDQVHVSPRSSHGSPCSFEQFLWEWNSFFLFRRHHHGGNITHNWSDLYAIVFADRTNFSHAMIGSSVHAPPIDNERFLTRLAAGDWTALPPVTRAPFNVLYHSSSGGIVRMWDSPPTEDLKPRRIEMTPINSAKAYFRRMLAFVT